MDIILEELGIPKQHIKETSIPDRFILIVDKSWLKSLKQDKKIVDFPIYKNGIGCGNNRKILPELGHPWTKVYIQNYKKLNQKVIPLPKINENNNNINNKLPMSYTEILSYISNMNYKNLWEQGYKKYPSAHIKYATKLNNNIIGGGSNRKSIEYNIYDNVLRELIQRIFHCTILNSKYCRINQSPSNTTTNEINNSTTTNNNNNNNVGGGDFYQINEEDENHENILPALIAIETTTYISVIFYPTSIETNLYDCITYSPAILQKTYNKPLFIFYQILQLTKYLHGNNLLLGDIQLNDIYLKENIWLQIIPKLESNLIQFNYDETPQISIAGGGAANNGYSVAVPPNTTNTIIDDSPEECIKFDLKFAYDLQQFTLREYCEMWCLGQLSNFDYLTILNNAAGRKIGIPGYHHIMPWVTDFQQRNGTNWRDLTKTKYRINKGDAHLDLMFTSAIQLTNTLGISNNKHGNINIGIGNSNAIGNNCVTSDNTIPHHVSDFLSEITYFVYMARRTSKNVLCQYVRPIWVPAEYPASIQRLQEWTPDECIPEFYSDPMVFKSIHEDLPDLEVPVWATCPEDFIAKHREALESQYVSERLHYWIDLNFGYKLTGKAAIKSKNVCLSLVDNHKNLTQRGIVQLFNHAHPPKCFPSQWFGRQPPRILTNNSVLQLHHQQQLARSSEDLSTNESHNNSNQNINNTHHKTTNRHRNNCETTSTKRRSGSTQRFSSNSSTGSTNLGSTSNLSDITSNMERSTSFYQNLQTSSTSSLMNNTIYLPKDYQPLALLNSLENTEQFFVKTFLDRKSDILSPLNEKLQQNDLLFDMESSGNSYTNRIFMESFEMNSSTNQNNKTNPKNLIVHQLSNSLNNSKQILNDKFDKDLKIIGCLMVELFLINKLRPLTMNCSGLEFDKRLESCKIVAKKFMADIPKCLQYAVKLFLNINDNNNEIITDRGLPYPTPEIVLEPILSNLLIPFPFNFFRIYYLNLSLHNFEMATKLLDLYTHFNCDGRSCSKYSDLDRKRIICQRKIAECKVNSCCKQIYGLLEPIAYEQFTPIELLLPHIFDLLNSEETSILTAWYLFDSVAAALGVKDTQKLLLEPILKLYDDPPGEGQRYDFWNKSFEIDSNYMKFRISSTFKSRKSVKLYHHSFLLRLIVRFGLKCFLFNFIPSLIEAVGGYKEPIESTGFHYHSNKSTSDIGFRGTTARSAKNLNLKFCCTATDESDNSLTLISPDHSDMKSDPTISICENLQGGIKSDIEDVFAFETEELDDNCGNTGGNGSEVIERNNSIGDSNGENQSIDSFEMPIKAEEATEDSIYLAEKLAINDIIYGGRLSNNSFDDDKISVCSSQKDSPQKLFLDLHGPKSPTIAIPPSTYRRTYELSTIDCEIGSKKSIDSFDFGASIAAASVAASNTRNDKNSNKNLSQEEDTDDSVVSKKSTEMKCLMQQDNRISKMSTESLIWLSHRLGPVLSARYLTRNLLRMLTLCYVGQENLLPENYEHEENGNLNYFSVADAKVVGDRCAVKILECLTSVSVLYGEQFILLQYLPHVSELIALCKKRITSSLEGALISSLQLLKYIIPCLNDSTIMEHLQDLILENIINPIINLIGTTRIVMPSGFLGRSVLARKLLDTIYVICVRIGPEMSKENLCTNALQKFFLIFDKAYGLTENFKLIELTNQDQTIPILQQISISPFSSISNNDNSIDDTTELLQIRERAIEEIRDVFSPNLAHCSYLAFLRYLGESIMIKTLLNLEFILTLCHEFEQPDYSATGYNDRQKRRQNFTTNRIGIGDRRDVNEQDEEFVESHSFGTFVVGNRIEVIHSQPKQEIGPNELLDMVAYKFEQINTTRHLRGNWLAYWRHEISRSDKDINLNLKQIKLQTFSGHTNSVRAILSLDNENSFMSASKDKTVKLWSLRSQGDGKKISQCQFNYNSHKKSVLSLAFLEAMRLVVSCDSGVHLWDPFIGRPIGILDSHKHSPVSVVRTYPSPSPLVIAGTAESTVKIIDSRLMEYVNEWRVTTNQNSTVRCLACAPSGNWIAVGLSSGNIIVLDGRTGIIMRSWKATDGELLQLVALNDQQIISSSLDYSISVWNIGDNYMQYHLKQPPEPAHCLHPTDTELVFATPTNRIGIYTDVTNSDASYSITKLRSETVKGVLTSLAVLPLNRMVLAGNDSGNIVLFC